MRFILDTSAFIGLGRNTLTKLSNAHEFLLPPYCFWELLTHLGEKDFDREKGQILKAEFCSFLDDHGAASLQAVGDTFCLDKLKDREADTTLLRRVLRELQNSNSLYEFYSRQFVDALGNTRQISGAVEVCKQRLAQAEDNHCRWVSALIERIRSGETQLNSEDDIHASACSIAHAQAKAMCHPNPDDMNVIDAYYPWALYIVLLAKRRLPRQSLPDKNDYEDALICRYILQNTPSTIIVTNENGQRELVKQVINILDSRVAAERRCRYTVCASNDICGNVN